MLVYENFDYRRFLLELNTKLFKLRKIYYKDKHAVTEERSVKGPMGRNKQVVLQLS